MVLIYDMIHRTITEGSSNPHRRIEEGNLQKQMNYGTADKHRRPVEQEKNRV